MKEYRTVTSKIKNISKIFPKRDILFFIVYILWFSLDYFYSLELSKYEIGRNTYYLFAQRPIKYLMILLCAFSFRFTNTKSICESGLYVVVLVFSFLMARKSAFYDVFYTFLIVYAARKIDVRKGIRITGFVLLGYILLTFVVCSLGVLDNITETRNGYVRNGFGFQHPTHLASRILMVFLCLSYTVKKRNQWFLYLCGIAMIFFIWFYQNVRVSSICIAMMMMFLLFSGVFEKMNGKTQKIFLYLLVFGALTVNLFMLISTITYSGEGILLRVNSLISGRLGQGNLAYKEYGLSLWGRQLFLTMSERKAAGLEGQIIIDCAYTNILLRGGIIVYALFSLTYLYGMIQHVRYNNYLEVCILFILACFGAIELDFYSAGINVFLLLMGKNAFSLSNTV